MSQMNITVPTHRTKKERYLMKLKPILLGTFILGLMLFTPAAIAQPSIIVTDYTINPENLMPGDTAILTLQIRNGEALATQTTTSTSGTESTSTTRTLGATIESIRIIPAQSGGNQIRATAQYSNLGFLAAGTGMTVTFKLLVDANLSEGVYFPLVDIDVSGGTDVSYPLLMKVSNASVDIIPKSVPSKISRGGTTELIITAINKRDNPVKEVILTPHGNNVEFVPQSYFLGSLAAETSQDIVFAVKPSGTGQRNISFDLSYKNGDNIHTNALVVPLTVIDALDVAPIITNFPISITKGGSSRISIEVYNAKTEKITGVLITPVCNTTIIPSQYFIGSMDPDDVFSASFDIYADMVDYGSHLIGFIVSFKQGNDYYETPIVTKAFSVVSGPGVSYQLSGGSSGSSESNGMPLGSSLLACITPVIIIIVVAVLFLIFYIRRKKRRQA